MLSPSHPHHPYYHHQQLKLTSPDFGVPRFRSTFTPADRDFIKGILFDDNDDVAVARYYPCRHRLQLSLSSSNLILKKKDQETSIIINRSILRDLVCLYIPVYCPYCCVYPDAVGLIICGVLFDVDILRRKDQDPSGSSGRSGYCNIFTSVMRPEVFKIVLSVEDLVQVKDNLFFIFSARADASSSERLLFNAPAILSQSV
jgi:hypothetical protein